MDQDKALYELHAALGHRRLSRSWAKLEILLGLLAAGTGLFLGDWTLAWPDVSWPLLAAALALFVLGAYLAMAGHRSHIYQSNNELAAYLAEVIRSTREP